MNKATTLGRTGILAATMLVGALVASAPNCRALDAGGAVDPRWGQLSIDPAYPGWVESEWFGRFDNSQAPWIDHEYWGRMYSIPWYSRSLGYVAVLWTPVHGVVLTGERYYRGLGLYSIRQAVWIPPPPIIDDPGPTEDRLPLAGSDFNEDLEDWMYAERVPAGDLVWTTGGGPDGSPAAVYEGYIGHTGAYFAAPAKFFGMMYAAYGGTLQFALHTSGRSQPSFPLVILDGPDGLRIIHHVAEIPEGWHAFEIPLDTRGEWVNPSREGYATEREIEWVLGELVNVRILAPMNTARLDDVKLCAAGPYDPPPVEPVVAEDKFDVGLNGWSGVSVVPPYDTFVWAADEGRTGGGLKWHYPYAATSWFLAPPAYLGDQSKAFGGALEFDIHTPQYETGRLGGVPLIALTGANGVCLEVFHVPASHGWDRYRCTLDICGGWRMQDEDRLATDDEIEAVLSDLAELRIRAVSQPAILDNVRLLGPPQ